MSVSAVVATIHLCIHQGGTPAMSWDPLVVNFSDTDWDYDEVTARIEKNIKILSSQNRVIAETIAMMMWLIVDNQGFTDHVAQEGENVRKHMEERLHAELRQCIEDVVEGHVEFESGELQKRLDRSVERQNKRLESLDRSIDHLNEWRNRSERKGKDPS